MIHLNGLTFSYGEKPLYKNVTTTIGNNQKVGIVGPNGSGKSTLLSIIMSKNDSYTGSVVVTGKIGYVPQEIKYDPEMEKSKTAKAYINANEHFQDHEIKKIIHGLGLDIDLDTDPGKLSGGQKTKLALSRALLEKPDILLLDEPTNFMDKKGKAWVMNFLSDYTGTVLVISHDLELMDRNIDKILAITPYNSTITEYKGNYTNYLKLKDEHEKRIMREHVIKTRQINRLEEGYKKMSQYDHKRAIRRRRIDREVEKLPDLPEEVRKIKMTLPEPKKVGEIPIKTTSISKSYGAHEVLKNVDFTIIRGQRIALIGANGSGKSTFIKVLMGLSVPDSGDVFRDEYLSVGYYSQEFELFNFENSIIDTFCEHTLRDIGFARSFLGRFMFSGDKIYQNVGTLSGGEKTRLAIAILIGKDNNLLILDEPTTYLDVLSQRIILDSLKEFTGTMIFVSHTPEFVKELAPTKAMLFPEQKLTLWDDEFLARVDDVGE